MSDYTKPSGYARLGWIVPAVDALMVAVNLVIIATTGLNPWNSASAVMCGLLGIFAFVNWRQEIAEDAAHRQRMADFDHRRAEW